MYSNRLLLAETLIAAIECGSFSAAAEKLGVSQSTVSRRIASLEEDLGGGPLFKRGSRWIEPTQYTLSYVEDIRVVLSKMEEAEARIRDEQEEPSGRLVVSMPPALGRAKFISPLATLLERYPLLSLELDLSEGYVDFSQSSVDLAVRIRPSKQSGISQTLIARSPLRYVAAASYLKGLPIPEDISDLDNHTLIALTSQNERARLLVGSRAADNAVAAASRLVTNDVSAILHFVRSGIGIGVLPDFLSDEGLNNGSLRALFPDRNLGALDIFALHPVGLKQSPKIAAGLAALKAVFED